MKWTLLCEQQPDGERMSPKYPKPLDPQSLTTPTPTKSNSIISNNIDFVYFELRVNKIAPCNLVFPLIVYLEDSSCCYELYFVHSLCYVLSYNYPKMYLTLVGAIKKSTPRNILVYISRWAYVTFL